MFRCFAAGCAVVSVALAIAAGFVFLVPGSSSRFYPVTHFWCFVPFVWGLWAMAAPKSWVPQRLPLWGAMLGLVVGVFLGFVLNLPSRVIGEDLSVALRGVLVLILVALYYLLWMVVRAAYRSLAPSA